MTAASRPAAAVLLTLTVVALGSMAAGCRKPPEKTPEGTLSLLRASLAGGNPPIDRVADTRLLNEAAALLQARNIEMNNQIPVTPRGLATLLEDVSQQADPRVFFRGALTLLRQGHCERIGDGSAPEYLRRVPEPVEGWPPVAMELQRSVARRMTNTIVADYRCDGGPSFGVVFSHPVPDDGTLRVAWIGAATHP